MIQRMVDYMLLSLAERKKHVDLDASCIERGGFHNNFRGVLAHFLNTEFPNGRRIYMCHACNNGKCSNPKHLYWGTPSENQHDYLNAGGTSPAQRTANKYTAEEHKQILSKAGRKGGLKSGSNGRANNPLGKNQHGTIAQR